MKVIIIRKVESYSSSRIEYQTSCEVDGERFSKWVWEGLKRVFRDIYDQISFNSKN